MSDTNMTVLKTNQSCIGKSKLCERHNFKDVDDNNFKYLITVMCQALLLVV